MRTERGRAALITRFITALRCAKIGPSFTYFYPSNYGGKTPYFMFSPFLPNSGWLYLIVFQLSVDL